MFMQVYGIDLSKEKFDINFIDEKGKEKNKEVKNGVVVYRQQCPEPEYHTEILNRKNYLRIDDIISTHQIITEGQRVVLGFSKKRAERDKKQRELLLERLQKRLDKSSKPKSVTKSAYNSYLTMEGESRMVIDPQKVKENAKWDGFFGFYTNNQSMSNKQIVLTYQMLWQIENSFYGKQKIMHSNQQKTSWVNLNALLLFINTLHKYVPDNSKYKKETFEKAYI